MNEIIGSYQCTKCGMTIRTGELHNCLVEKVMKEISEGCEGIHFGKKSAIEEIKASVTNYLWHKYEDTINNTNIQVEVLENLDDKCQIIIKPGNKFTEVLMNGSLFKTIKELGEQKPDGDK